MDKTTNINNNITLVNDIHINLSIIILVLVVLSTDISSEVLSMKIGP